MRLKIKTHAERRAIRFICTVGRANAYTLMWSEAKRLHHKLGRVYAIAFIQSVRYQLSDED